MRDTETLIPEIMAQLIRGDADAVGRLTQEALDEGIPVDTILQRGLIAGMKVIGVRFRDNEVFLPEVLVAARAMKAGVARLEPLLIDSGIKPAGKVLIATVKGDIHDIGKNLVGIMLRGAGFEVIDLGVGVTEQKFIGAMAEHQPDILAMSALLTTTMIQMETNIKSFRDSGVLARTKIMIGGAPVTRSFAQEIGADAYGRNATEAVERAQQLMKDLKATG